MTQHIDPNRLPSKTVMSATYQSIENPPDPGGDINPQDPKTWPYLKMGILNQYRTLFFDRTLVSGPFEQVMTVGPSETVEVSVEIDRRLTIEEQNEATTQVTSQQGTDTMTQDELSDKVSSVIQRNESSSGSINVSGVYSVVSGGLSASSNYSSSQTDSSERMRRTMNQTTQRVSQQLSKSYTFRTRRTEETSTRDIYRRLIRNESDRPRHFGLRRVQQSYSVAVQYSGPRLIFQTLLIYPGAALGVPRVITEEFLPGPFLMQAMRELRISVPHIGVISFDTSQVQIVAIVQLKGSMQERRLAAQFLNGFDTTGFRSIGSTGGNPWDVQFIVKIDSITDGPNADDYSLRLVITQVSHTGTLPPKIDITVPSPEVISINTNSQLAWSATPTLSEFLKKYRDLLLEVSSVNPRQAGDLRREERDEILRVVLALFDFVPQYGSVKARDMSDFASIFDTEATFFQLYPPFYKTARNVDPLANTTAFRSEYDIFKDLPAAPLGASLGWRFQVDGDSRRNEFLNSPLARVCIPISQGFEQTAIDFITKRSANPYWQISSQLVDFLDKLQIRRTREKKATDLGLSENSVDLTHISPKLDEATAPDDQLAVALYPVKDIFDTNDPLKGFIYDPVDS